MWSARSQCVVEFSDAERALTWLLVARVPLKVFAAVGTDGVLRLASRWS